MSVAKSKMRVWISIPEEVKLWAQARAKYHGASLSAEIVMSLREGMERERKAAGQAAMTATE